MTIDCDNFGLFADRVEEGRELQQLIAATNQVGARMVELFGLLDPATVPDPPRPEPQDNRDDPVPDDPLRADKARAAARSAHPPFRNSTCGSCHTGDEHPVAGRAKPGQDPWTACANCDDNGGNEAGVHGGTTSCTPIAVGPCKGRHVPHTPVRDHLLTLAPTQPCLKCHEK